MFRRRDSFDDRLAALSAALAALRPRAVRFEKPIARLLADADAARFHAGRDADGPTLVAVIGGTGTGKSTLVNRLLGREVTAASFRRTHTAGPVAVAKSADAVPPAWPGVPHDAVQPDATPRGTADVLTVVTADAALLEKVVLTDTPDLDGDRPAHTRAGRPPVPLGRRRGVRRDARKVPTARFAAVLQAGGEIPRPGAVRDEQGRGCRGGGGL